MPTLPLYTSPDNPDGWHQVASPGGYETWHVDAEDDASGIRITASLSEGSNFHPGYLRRYARYRTWPTRLAPPLPRKLCCVMLSVYEGPAPIARVFEEVPCDISRISNQAADIRFGANHFTRQADATAQLVLRGTPFDRGHLGPRLLANQTVTLTLSLHPSLQIEPANLALGNSPHHCIISAPLCRVEGEISLFDAGGIPKNVTIAGRGYRDHWFGTRPLAWDFGMVFRGRVLFEDATLAFVHAVPRDRSISPILRTIEADRIGVREIASSAAVQWGNAFLTSPAYPVSFKLADHLELRHPRPLSAGWAQAHILYEVISPRGTSTALCEIIDGRRLRWPLVGLLSERGIHR